MKVKFFTLPFDESIEGFPEEAIDGFCSRHKVKKLETNFFHKGDQIFWTVAVHYEPLLEGTTVSKAELSGVELRLYNKLAEWRGQFARQAGYPSYVICNNAQLVQIVRQKCITLDALGHIRGIGKKKVQNYGKFIIQIIKDFYSNGNTEKSTK